MLVTLVAICIAWWSDPRRETAKEYDVPGPLTVSYSVRTSPTSTAGNKFKGASGIDFRGNHIVVHTKDGGLILASSSLIDFHWYQD